MKIPPRLAGALLLPVTFVGALLASQTSLVAASITVPNFSFESGQSNWTQSVGSGTFGTYTPSVGTNGYVAPNGGVVAYVYAPGNSAAQEIVSSASLGTIVSNMTYTLTVAVGNDKSSSSNANVSANIALLAGGTVIPRAVVTGIHPAAGTIGDYSVTFSTVANDPLAGQALTIRLGQDAGFANYPAPNFDNVRLTATTATGNQLDRIDFGNTASESAHAFDSGFSALPQAGVGGLGQTYRAPYGTNGSSPTAGNGELQFTMTVDPAKQNYLSVRLWGNDKYAAALYLSGTESIAGPMDATGGPSPFPNRFYFDTVFIPLSMTQGKTSVQLVLYENNTSTTLPARPIYSAYTHTEPCFIPSGADPTGTPPTVTGQLATTTLSTNQVVTLLQTNRQSIYGSGGYYDSILARQVMPGTSGAPSEVIGLDLYTSLSSFSATNPTLDQWRDQCGSGQHGPGYSTVPDEMLTALTATYLLPPFTDANGNTVSGLDHYHDSSIIQRIVSCLDGASYMQSSDGHYQNLPDNVWAGVTSSPRATGHTYAGSKSRGPGWSISLEGGDTDSLGRTIIALLNDSTAAPIFKSYLTQSYDADLTGGSMMRAYAYERMLNNQIGFLYSITTAGTIAQGLLNVDGIYTNLVALNKLQALYPYPTSTSTFPNDSYSYPYNYPSVSNSNVLSYLQQITGIVAGSTIPGLAGPSGYTNYAVSTGGFGEAHGTLSGGYDGRYGSILPWMLQTLVAVAAGDPNVSSSVLSQIKAQAQAASNGYLRFISPLENYLGTTDKFTLAQEDFITYRDPYNINANAGGFTVGVGYQASDPNLGINSALERRGAYLEALYNYLPSLGKGGNSQLCYLATLASYEATLRGLINVNPSTLTPLPGEPGQPNSASVDVETGTTALYYYGERFYANLNWRNFETQGNKLGGTSYLFRVHDTMSTVDRAALVYTEHDSTTLQSDGNSSGTVSQPYYARYGNWLIAGNPTGSASTVKLPVGSGVAVDAATGNKYNMGSSFSLPAGGTFALNMPIPATGEVIPGGTYVMTNQSSFLVLNCPNGAATNNLQIVQAALPAGSASQWVFTYIGNGLYTIRNVASGLYLTDANGSTSQGAALVQQPADNKSDQAWQVVPSGGAFVFVNQAGGLDINNPGSSTTAGQGMVLWSQDGGANSVWALQMVASATPQPIANGNYVLTLESDGLALEDPNGSTTVGTSVQQNLVTNATNQQWTFTYQGNSLYTIKNVAASLYLGSNTSGGSLGLYAADGGTDQLWRLLCTDRGYVLVNALNGNAIDDPYGSSQTNWAMQFYSYGGGGNQTWVFQAH